MSFVRLYACVLAFLCVLPGTAAADSSVPTITAFTNVHVVPMDRQRVLPGQTVLVRDGTIVAIGRTVDIPVGAQTIDGRGAWLSPGLADMHNHVDGANDLAVQLSLGVTTMFNMGEARNSFVGRTRAAVARGDIPGPRIFTALAVDGSSQYGHLVVASADDAQATVQVAKANGYDFLKVYNNLSPEAFGAIVKAAAAAKIPLVGHGVTSVGLARQLEAGQGLVAHAEEFFYTFFPDPDQADANAAPNAEDIPGAIALLRDHDAFVVADLVAYGAIARQWGRPQVVEQFLASPEARYLAPGYRVSWASSGYARRSGSLDARRRFLDLFVKQMNAAGVHLLSGTDSPDIPGLVPGFALHENLRALEAAGLSRFDALATATRNPGIFIRRSHPELPPFGTVAVGGRADLILTSANPLDDLGTLAHPTGVMANGRWFPQPELSALRERVSIAYRKAELSNDLLASAASGAEGVGENVNQNQNQNQNPRETRMKVRDLYPLITTPRLFEARDFYTTVFDFEVVFESSWFVYLAGPAEEGARGATLAFMSPEHPSSPPGPEAFDGTGMILTMEVSDAREVLKAIQVRGASIVYPLTDEEWGQRRFMVRDPAGMMVDVVQQIEPKQGYWDRYPAPRR